LVGLPVVIIGATRQGNESAIETDLLTHLRLTHRSKKLERYAQALGKLLPQLLEAAPSQIRPLVCSTAESLGFPAARVVEQVERDNRSDLEVIGNLLSPACYIDQSFPSVLYLAARYSNDFEAALIANANVGGDNCHRGAVLGALLGAALGFQSIPPRWISGLRDRAELEVEIDSFVDCFTPAA
jgi:ADP-ribosylglycohydrolase